jgi:chromosomal replication initiation ATPase DnaA
MIEYIEEIINEAWIESNESFDKQNTLNKINALYCVKIRIHNKYELLDFILTKYTICIEDMRSISKRRKFAFPRQLYCYLARNIFRDNLYTFEEIGTLVNRKNCNTQYAVKEITNQMEVNRKLRNKVNNIINQLIT